MLNGAIVTQGLTSSVCVCTVGVLIIPHMKVHLRFFPFIWLPVIFNS